MPASLSPGSGQQPNVTRGLHLAPIFFWFAKLISPHISDVACISSVYLLSVARSQSSAFSLETSFSCRQTGPSIRDPDWEKGRCTPGECKMQGAGMHPLLPEFYCWLAKPQLSPAAVLFPAFPLGSDPTGLAATERCALGIFPLPAAVPGTPSPVSLGHGSGFAGPVSHGGGEAEEPPAEVAMQAPNPCWGAETTSGLARGCHP